MDGSTLLYSCKLGHDTLCTMLAFAWGNKEDVSSIQHAWDSNREIKPSHVS